MDNVKKYTHSNFFTNRDNNTLIKEFEGILHHNPHICNLDAVVGFLRASGYFSSESAESLKGADNQYLRKLKNAKRNKLETKISKTQK